MNLYGMVGNDPLNWIDPFGLKYAERYAVYGAVAGGGLVAIASVPVDFVTFGANIVVSPLEVAGGAVLGGAAGYLYGSLVDIVTGNSGSVSSASSASTATTASMARHESGQWNYICDMATRQKDQSPCAFLDMMMCEAKRNGDTKKMLEIKIAQKVFGCRRNNG